LKLCALHCAASPPSEQHAYACLLDSGSTHTGGGLNAERAIASGVGCSRKPAWPRSAGYRAFRVRKFARAARNDKAPSLVTEGEGFYRDVRF
jgi:hypothetical protein